MNASHEDGVIGLIECTELAVIDEPWRYPANAREGDDLVRPLGARAVQRVFVLELGAAEIEKDALKSFGMLSERLAPMFLDGLRRDQVLQIVALNLVEAAKIERVPVIAFSRFLGKRLAAFFGAGRRAIPRVFSRARH